MNHIQRKFQILWLSLRIRHHRIAMDAERGITARWKYHARAHTALCRQRAEMQHGGLA